MSEEAFSASEATRRSDLVYERLTQSLIALEIPPGTALSENKLAKEMGVSRTPVRAALRQLELEGLLEQPSGSSYVVRGLTPRDVNEICDLLEVLDCYIVTRAIQHCPPETFDALIGYTAEMKAAAQAQDIERWGLADREFHKLIEAGADNELITSLAVKTRRRIHRFWATSVRPERLQECSAEHERIARAMRDGDVESVVSMVKEHIAHMRLSLTDLLMRAAAFLPRGTSGGPTGRRAR
ncbi:GntR family transcriptional regulator [Ancylobacter mangrovi]|uniref:GntR family transcriptional regulator n=1 Tax=Ancylobacter mangrovi TaxID=2972472 RepID=A0A9X2PB18_9HYPH|nr:GntR family transcriptional regulator [Ancylobacter mangrovi]MCS0494635.1 GntR family transcriptional regulator [Ancylobacter mangrovi]MCS0502036.1 GntR family transcriptional regulator [Ancylobacter mangrovi]